MKDRIQQQMYTRERGGIFHATDGYDTIAISARLDQAFVSKYLHPFCLYDSPKSLVASGEKDITQYPEAVTIFQPKTGDLVVGQAVFVPADFTGERSTYFMHNYVIPQGRKEEWIKNPGKLFQMTGFCISYDVSLGQELEELEDLEHDERPAEGILGDLEISVEQFKQLLFAVMSSVAGKKKVFVSLKSPLQEYSKHALRLLELIWSYLPYAHRRRFGALTFTSDPVVKNYLHVVFFEPGTLNFGDRSLEKQFIFDFAGGSISGVEITGQKHEYLDLALDYFSKGKPMDDFFMFAEESLSGLSEDQKLELASYYQLADFYLDDFSIYRKNKLGYLLGLNKFLQVNSERKPALLSLFLRLLQEERVAGDAEIAAEFIQTVISLNTFLRHDEPLSFILSTLQYYQGHPLLQQLWKVVEQDKPTCEAILSFIHDHQVYADLLQVYLEETLEPLTKIEEILAKISELLAAPFLLNVETFRTVVNKAIAATVRAAENPFMAVCAVKNFDIDIDDPQAFQHFKKDLLKSAVVGLLYAIDLEKLSIRDVLMFGEIVPKEVRIKDDRIKRNYSITYALYQLLSEPGHSRTAILQTLRRQERGELRKTLRRLLQGEQLQDHLSVLVLAFESELGEVDYNGLFSHSTRYGGAKAAVSFIKENVALLGSKQYKQALKSYLVDHPESIWKNRAYRKELATIRNSSLKGLLKEVELETSGLLGKLFKKRGLSLVLAVALLGAAGGGALIVFGDRNVAPPKAVKTNGTETGTKKRSALESFKQFSSLQKGSIVLNGEMVQTIDIHPQPDGNNLYYLMDTTNTAIPVKIEVNGETSPFDKKERLLDGFSLYGAEHDFDSDASNDASNIVLAASNNQDETYVWVYSLNSSSTKNDPLTPIFQTKGASAELKLEGNKLTLPLTNSKKIQYQYSTTENKFIKKK
ncbi:hypothetical protein [Bacillus sp. JJ1764]|uniref:GAP1-N2 domain-containing protein n=1 Tax=Bacillus sp. JJ1764 TaxID=3122964 RepID=UPI00300015FE